MTYYHQKVSLNSQKNDKIYSFLVLQYILVLNTQETNSKSADLRNNF